MTLRRNRSPRPAGPQVQFDNDLYRIILDRTTGAITSLRVKNGDWEVLSGPGNIVAREQDRGDLWELYKGLDGGSRVAMTTQQKVPAADVPPSATRGRANPGPWSRARCFPSCGSRRPFGSGKFATTVRVIRQPAPDRNHHQAGQIRTSSSATRPFSRRRSQEGKSTHEIPFGSIDRPAAIEFPAQNWVDHGDGRHGLALLNIGLPGNLVTDGTMMVSLLRAHTLGAYGFGGGYEPGMSSDSGYQLGQERTMQYALVPHSGDWRQARRFSRRSGVQSSAASVAMS